MDEAKKDTARYSKACTGWNLVITIIVDSTATIDDI